MFSAGRAAYTGDMKSSITTADGLKLHVHEWPKEGASGTVLIVHGLGEHIGRYEHVAARLNGWGWRVVGFDHRGHGRSEGGHGRLPSGEALLEDLARVIDGVRAEHPGPLVLLGHSMGGLVAARYCAEAVAGGKAAWQRQVDALVLSSPALDAGMNVAQKLLLSVLGPLAPDLAVNNGLKPEWISRDVAVVKAYKDDPLVHDRITPRLVRFIVDGGEFVRRQAAHWSLPTLLLYAGSDRCVAPGGSAAFAQAAPPAVVTSLGFAPLYHEIFNEPEQGDVFVALGEWMSRLSVRP